MVSIFFQILIKERLPLPWVAILSRGFRTFKYSCGRFSRPSEIKQSNPSGLWLRQTEKNDNGSGLDRIQLETMALFL